MLTKETIVALLETNDRAIGRALVALLDRQTADEQATGQTRHHNGMGFTGADAEIGTSMARFFLSRGYLTPKQVAYWRKPRKDGKMKIAIYAGQLLEVAKERQAQAEAA